MWMQWQWNRSVQVECGGCVRAGASVYCSPRARRKLPRAFFTKPAFLMISRAFGRKLSDVLGPLFPPLYFLYLLVDDRRSARFFPLWIRSFCLSHDSVHNGLPWLPLKLIQWLDVYLNSCLISF